MSIGKIRPAHIDAIRPAISGLPDSAPFKRSPPAGRGKSMLVAALLALSPATEGLTAAFPGLHTAAGQVLRARAQSLQLQATLEENYPHSQIVHTQDVGGCFETRLNGLFRHAKVIGLGDEYRYDSDQLEAGLRWQMSGAGKAGLSLVPAAGYSRISERHRYSDGRRGSSARGYYWAEISGAASFGDGLSLTAVARGLREIVPDTDTTATIFSVELPSINHMTLLGDMGVFIDNPGEWRKPWAAGARMRYEKHNLYIYLSNTWGVTMPASLAGTDMLFYNLRIALNM